MSSKKNDVTTFTQQSFNVAWKFRYFPLLMQVLHMVKHQSKCISISIFFKITLIYQSCTIKLHSQKLISFQPMLLSLYLVFVIFFFAVSISLNKCVNFVFWFSRQY